MQDYSLHKRQNLNSKSVKFLVSSFNKYLIDNVFQDKTNNVEESHFLRLKNHLKDLFHTLDKILVM